MKAFTVIGSSEFFRISPTPHLSTRIQHYFPGKFVIGRGKSAVGFKSIASYNPRPVPPSLIAAEKEEARAVLTLFLKKLGLGSAVAARTINKSEPFVDHLVSRLHSIHKSRYLVGRELTTLEIRDALIPYLESLQEEHRNSLVDVVESFPNPPVRGKSVAPPRSSASPRRSPVSPPCEPVSSPHLNLDSKKQRAVSRVDETGPDGELRPQILYLLDLGLDLEQIKVMTRRFPSFPYYSLEGKIKPIVEFLLELGVPKSDIPVILSKRPQLCGISLSENLKPTMTFLENLGVDKKKWAKVIYRFPALLTYSRQKLNATVDFLTEMGLSGEEIGKILTRCPNIISYSVDDKLRPTAKYFQSLGVDVAVLLHRCPQTFGLSIEGNLKPVTEFFIEKGYSLEEVRTMISRYGALYTFSLSENLVPKWDYFLTMEYQKSELVKFPQYFGYSLTERIKPRYALVKESGVKLLLNQVLSLSGTEFHRVLEKKMKKMLSDQSHSDETSTKR